MWVLAIHLPLMIGNNIPEDDTDWECFLTLLEILKISTARIVSKDLSNYLSALITNHHQLFTKCYPDSSITPKMHFMVHFPSQMMRYYNYCLWLINTDLCNHAFSISCSLICKIGPLVSVWCMRMEAKNYYFKKVGKVGNFKNVAYTVATRHQRLMCAYLHDDEFFSSILEHGPGM